jgi:hypothetical protein
MTSLSFRKPPFYTGAAFCFVIPSPIFNTPKNSPRGRMTTCKNCETTFEGKYCPNCSQKADTHRFTLAHLAHELLHALTHTDKGIIFLIKEMLYRPGKVALEYNAGKRKKYFNPISFLLIMMALQIFLAKKTHIYEGYFEQTEQLLKGISKSYKVKELEKDNQLEIAKKQNPKLQENIKAITFLFLPLLSLFTWFLFKKTKNTYAENLVFNVLIQGQTYLYFVFCCIIPFAVYPHSVLLTMYLYLVTSIAYSIFAYRQFYQQRWGITIFKGLVAHIVYIACMQQITNIVIDFL